MARATTTLIYETVHGSRAYGLAREGSDTDLKGVIVGPKRWYFGFRGGPEQVEHDADHVWLEVRKFLRLAVANNPTILELLFTDAADHRTVTTAGSRLLEAAPGLLSKRVADTFGGYARGQLARIRTHRRWLLSPPTEAPRREAFGLPPKAPVSRDQLGAAEAMLADGTLAAGSLSNGFQALLAKEKRYRAAQQEWTQYRQWQKHRNPTRAALEKEHGYDTKHAMHLVRLLRMAVEILERGEVRVRRPDREELLAVRDGCWSYDTLVEHADTLAEQVRHAATRSSLPDTPDEATFEDLGIAIVEDVLGC